MLNSEGAQRFSESYELERFERLPKSMARILTFVCSKILRFAPNPC
jgi:hypothetical protein